MVFNRAKPHDFQTSAHSHSLSMVSKSARPSTARERDFRTIVKSPEGQQAKAFGPVAQAVACTAILPQTSFSADDPNHVADRPADAKPAAAKKMSASTLPLIVAVLIMAMIGALAYIAMYDPADANNAPASRATLVPQTQGAEARAATE
jgi:hypothetical protein